MFLEEEYGIAEAVLPEIFRGERILAEDFFCEISFQIDYVNQHNMRNPLLQWLFELAIVLKMISKIPSEKKERLKSFMLSRNEDDNEEREFVSYRFEFSLTMLAFFSVKKPKNAIFHILKIINNSLLLREGRLDNKEWRNKFSSSFAREEKKTIIIALTIFLFLSRVKPENENQRRKIISVCNRGEKAFSHVPIIVDACRLAKRGL